ncbi:MAG: bifunctional enoyl-CoA hydratase/phosphate acetyltransferase [Burkholderiales bacterium]|nr:bifunctional enoyl-CoA hydratase/phosphate acetyltransferase [Burkholderiales bacterium]
MTAPSLVAAVGASAADHPRLLALIERARGRAAAEPVLPTIAVVYPCDKLALEVARHMAGVGLARPLLIGAPALIERAAAAAGIELAGLDVEATGDEPCAAAQRAVELARAGRVQALMKGSLHTDELLSAVVHRETGLRTGRRISHVFVFDLPRYPKLLALADCAVNIAPDLNTKCDILSNAVDLLCRIGIAQPKVGVVAAVETVNSAIPATVDAQALVAMARQGAWPQAIVEGPFGFDNAISAEAARIKKIDSRIAGDVDLLIVPDLNSGNMLYKSFNYIGGGDCAGLVVGARVPVVLTSRADSALSRIASVALAVLAGIDAPRC